MLFRFDNFCEDWAQIYKPIGHVPSKDGRRTRFFRHNNLNEYSEIQKRLASADKCNLFMSVITALDGEAFSPSESAAQPGFVFWRRHVLFWSHQAPATSSRVPLDEESAADAKARGMEAAIDFMNFIADAQNPHKHPRPQDRIIEGVVLESFEFSTAPVVFDGWWITIVNFSQREPRMKCVVEERYIKDSEKDNL